VSCRGVQYVLSIMRKYIIVKVGRIKKTNRTKIGGSFRNCAAIGEGEICIMGLGDGRPWCRGIKRLT